MARVAIFTGQVRDENELLSQVDLFRLTNVFDRILVSTWSNYPRADELRRKLSERGAELLLPDMPRNVPRWSGTRHYQIFSLAAALDVVAPDDTVFKTRHEAYLPPDLVIDAVNLQSAATIAEHWPFRRRLWVPSYRPTVCFYVDDKCVLGLARDLRLLCDYRDSFDVPFCPFIQVEHVPRWGLPLVDRYPVFADFMEQLYNPFGPCESRFYAFARGRPGFGGELRQAIDDAYRSSPDYATVMTAYALFVRDCLSFSPIAQLSRATFRGAPLAKTVDEFNRDASHSTRMVNEPMLWNGSTDLSALPADAQEVLRQRLDPRRTAQTSAQAVKLARAWFLRRGWKFGMAEAAARTRRRLGSVKKKLLGRRAR